MTICKQASTLLLLGCLFFVLSGCSSMPSYQSMENNADRNIANTAVNYRIDPSLSSHGMECLAILPLDIGPDALDPIVFSNLKQSHTGDPIETVQNNEIYDLKLDANDKQQMLREMLYAFIAPHKARDIELADVDRWAHAGDPNPNYKKLAKKLDCDWFLEGEISKFSVNYYGLYSNVMIAADLQIIRAKDKKVVWQGSHEASSHDGSLPLSPIDLAMGAVKAASNINPEQVERIAGDVARRLTRTMPLEANNNFLFAAKRKQLLRVIASNLNLRKGPGRDYAVSKVLKKQEQVTFLENASTRPWLLVQTKDGVKGYVSGQYLN